MKVGILGGCGFVGKFLADCFIKQNSEQVEVIVLDNLSRTGSSRNVAVLEKLGGKFIHGDIREPDDVSLLGSVDWIIDAAANPSVLSGIEVGASRPLMMQNLVGTINGLEHAKKVGAGFTLLSSSRVYSIKEICGLARQDQPDFFAPNFDTCSVVGLSKAGIGERFSTEAPISLYGASKLASEVLCAEYSHAFDMPIYINRCGVLAGEGQFGRPDQGIFSFWLNAYKHKRAMRYIGFDGSGRQCRDCLHPEDLFALIQIQMRSGKIDPRPFNVSGGMDSLYSLKQISAWAAERWGPHEIGVLPDDRPFDLPWVVLDSSRCEEVWGWQPKINTIEILNRIANHADENPDWLSISGVH